MRTKGGNARLIAIFSVDVNRENGAHRSSTLEYIQVEVPEKLPQG